MNGDSEFEAWQRDWQADSPDTRRAELASRLRDQVVRQSRLQLIGMVAPIAVTVGVGWYLLDRVMNIGRAIDMVMAIEGAIFIVLTWAVVLWSSRGTWRPLTETTSGFLDLSIRRCQANARVAPIAAFLYVVQLIAIVLLSWLYSDASLAEHLLRWPLLALCLVGLPALLVWGGFYTRSQKERLKKLEKIRREFEVGSASD